MAEKLPIVLRTDVSPVTLGHIASGDTLDPDTLIPSTIDDLTVFVMEAGAIVQSSLVFDASGAAGNATFGGSVVVEVSIGTRGGLVANGATQLGFGTDLELLLSWQNDLLDRSGNDRHQTENLTTTGGGSLTYTAGRVNEASVWAGADGEIYIDTGVTVFGAATLSPDTGVEWSVSFWTRFPSTEDGGVVISRGDAFGGNQTTMIWVDASADNVRLNLRGSITNYSLDVDDGEWHHHLLTWDGTTATYYYDGEAQAEPAVGTTVANGNIIIGALRDTAGGATPEFNVAFTGQLDDMLVYSRVLSAAEAQLFQFQGDDFVVMGDGAISGDLDVLGGLSVGGTLDFGGGFTVGGLATTRVLEANLELWIATTGDDVTGDGSESAPYATLGRVQEHYGQFVPAGHTITVHIEPGIYSFTSSFTPNYTYGTAVTFDSLATGGFVAAASGKALSNFDVSYSTDASFAGLQYFDMDVELTGYTVVVGEFLFVTAATGGTNPTACLGLHKVIAWDSGNELATVRVWSRVGVSALPSGSISATVAQFKTVFQWNLSSSQYCVNVTGLVDSGTFNRVVFEGADSSEFTNVRGVNASAGGIFRCNTLGIHGLDRAFFPTSLGVIQCSGSCAFSKLQNYAAQVSFQCDVDLGSPTINGVSTSAFIGQSGSRIRCQSGKIIGCGNAFAVQAEQCTMLLFDTDFFYGDGSTIAVEARVGAVVDARNCTFTGYTTDTDSSDATGVIVT